MDGTKPHDRGRVTAAAPGETRQSERFVGIYRMLISSMREANSIEGLLEKERQAHRVLRCLRFYSACRPSA